MEYRRLGRSGLKVSALSFGSWETFGKDDDFTRACLAEAYGAGVNYFDTAEGYTGGEAESSLGRVLADLGWPRASYVLSTKFFFGLSQRVNLTFTLNRKYLLQAIDGSLDRLGLDFIDIIFCHRPDPQTPIEETVWAMSDIIGTGKALYWGTSEWPADDIRAACEIAERHHLRAPIVEQPQYNLLARQRVEQEYARLYDDVGLGLTIWSPLASGLLTGKYVGGVPEDSRAVTTGLSFIRDRLIDPKINEKVAAFVAVAREADLAPAPLALAWCLRNPHVSTVITGASKPAQLRENLAALDALEAIDDALAERIESIFA